MKRFVIVVDTQADFIHPDGALPVPGAVKLVVPMQEWLASLRAAKTAGVLFTFDTHDPGAYLSSAEADAFPPHCLRGTPGWENVIDASAIDPSVPVYRLTKGVFDMWAEPGATVEAVGGVVSAGRERFFERLLREGITTVTVIGVAADYCVRWAIAGLLERGFAVEVPFGLTCGIARSIEDVVRDEFAGVPVLVDLALEPAA